MIKKLRLKFTYITMSILFIVLVVIIGGINLTMYRSSQVQSSRMMQDLLHTFTKPMPDKPFNKPRDIPPLPSILIQMDEHHTVQAVIQNRSHETEETLTILALKAIGKGEEIGSIGNYSFLCKPTASGHIIVLLDRSIEMQLLTSLFIRSVGIGLLSFIILSFISFLLSGWAVKPVAIAFEKQQRFISDASHELKTPLAVIATNAKVLENEIGPNKWLSYIQEQSERMRILTLDLLSLARLEGAPERTPFTSFNLSQAILGEALSFESTAFEQSKTLTTQIAEGLWVKGDESSIRQLVSILLDNAIKHAGPSGHINLTLSEKGKKKILTVFNSDSHIKDSLLTKVFERFYRIDESRSRETGGYGLGLSIAKAIVDTHSDHISICNKDGGVLVSVTLTA